MLGVRFGAAAQMLRLPPTTKFLSKAFGFVWVVTCPASDHHGFTRFAPSFGERGVYAHLHL
jgi:hypothetical protein